MLLLYLYSQQNKSFTKFSNFIWSNIHHDQSLSTISSESVAYLNSISWLDRFNQKFNQKQSRNLTSIGKSQVKIKAKHLHNRLSTALRKPNNRFPMSSWFQKDDLLLRKCGTMTHTLHVLAYNAKAGCIAIVPMGYR